MGKLWNLTAECLIQQNLLGSIGDVVFASNHMGNGHIHIVYNDGQVIEGLPDAIDRRCSSNDHITAQIATLPSHGAADQIMPLNGTSVLNFEANDRLPTFGLKGTLLLVGQGAVTVVVAGCLVFSFLRGPHGV